MDEIHKKTPEIVVFEFTRVVFGVSPSPFLLNPTIKHHLKRYKEFPEFVQTFLRSVYVDDVSFVAKADNSTYKSETIITACHLTLVRLIGLFGNLKLI